MRTVIHNGKIFDSAKRSFFPGSIVLEGDRILSIHEGDGFPQVPGDSLLDARGAYVAPGFIDIHSHADTAVFDPDYQRIKLGQGVTTEIVGNCGFSVFPVNGRHEDVAKELYPVLGEVTLHTDFISYDRSVQALPQRVHSFVGHNTLVLDGANIGNEVARMISQGALGFSTGLDYYPGRDSLEGQVMEGVRAAKGSFYVTHHRGIRDYVGGIHEAGRLADGAGVPGHVSHVKPRWPLLDGSLDALGAYGLTFDTQTYPMTSSNIATIIPPDCYTEGIGKLAQSLREGDTGLMRRIEEGSHNLVTNLLPFENITVTYHPNPDYLGRSIADIASGLGMRPWDAAYMLLVESEGNCSILKKWKEIDDGLVHAVATQPGCIISSDGIPAKAEGSGYTYCHPRLFYTFPVAVGNWVVEGIFTPGDAVAKVSSMPAALFGLPQGALQPGKPADIVVFDPSVSYVGNPLRNPMPCEIRPYMMHVVSKGEVLVKDYTFRF